MASENDIERFDEQGVDLTLVRYTLGLTPTERLKALENFMNAMASVRPGSAKRTHSSATTPTSDQLPENE
jgi:hypothetical protein